MTDAQAPMGAPGCIINWPMLKIHYRTDPKPLQHFYLRASQLAKSPT